MSIAPSVIQKLSQAPHLGSNVCNSRLQERLPISLQIMEKILVLSGLDLLKLTTFITSYKKTLLKSEGIPFKASWWLCVAQWELEHSEFSFFNSRHDTFYWPRHVLNSITAYSHTVFMEFHENCMAVGLHENCMAVCRDGVPRWGRDVEFHGGIATNKRVIDGLT